MNIQYRTFAVYAVVLLLALGSALAQTPDSDLKSSAFAKEKLARFQDEISRRHLGVAEKILQDLVEGSSYGPLRPAASELASAWMREGDYARAAKLLATLIAETGETEAKTLEDWNFDLEFARVAMAAPPQSVSRRVRSQVSCTRDKAGLQRIPAKVMNQAQEMVWDTGANVSTVNESSAQALGLRFLPGYVRVGSSTGATVEARLAVAEVVEIGECVVNHVLFLVLPDANLSYPEIDYKIEAIAGFPLIDALGTLRIGNDETIVLAEPPLQEGPPNLRFDGMTPLIEVAMGGRSLLLMMDSGANHSELAPAALEGMNPRPTTKAGKLSRTGGAAGFNAEKRTETVDVEIEIGGRSLFATDLAVGSEQIGTKGTLGVLGNDLLSLGGAYWLDFRNLRLRYIRDEGER